MTEEVNNPEAGGNGNDGDKTPTITPEQFAEMQAEVERLRAHSEELLAEKKKEQAKAKEASEAARAAEEAKLREEGQWQEIAKRAEEQSKTWEQKYAELNTEIARGKIKNEFNKALDELKVKPEAKPLVESALLNNFEVGPEGRIITKDGVSLSDFMSDWSQSDTAKLIIAAEGNSGGGTSNPGSSGGLKSIEGKNLTELTRMKKDGVITDTEYTSAIAKL